MLLQRTFSEPAHTPASSKRAFTCLIKFLTDMVPFESSSHLKVWHSIVIMVIFDLFHVTSETVLKILFQKMLMQDFIYYNINNDIYLLGNSNVIIRYGSYISYQFEVKFSYSHDKCIGCVVLSVDAHLILLFVFIRHIYLDHHLYLQNVESFLRTILCWQKLEWLI